MLPTLSFTNEIIVIALLALSVLSVLTLISLRRKPGKSNREEHDGTELTRSESSLAHLITNLDKVTGITFSAVVTTTGRVLASSASSDAVATKATSELLEMYNFSKRMAHDLGREELEELTLSGKDGFLLVESMGEDVLLLVTADQDANHERVAEKMQEIAEEIYEILTQPKR